MAYLAPDQYDSFYKPHDNLIEMEIETDPNLPNIATKPYTLPLRD